MNKEYFDELMVKNRYNYQTLSKEIGIDAHSLSNKVKGKSEFKASEMITIAKCFGISEKSLEFNKLFFS